jgi:tetratricopeptide (TPR) repeat protein
MTFRLVIAASLIAGAGWCQAPAAAPLDGVRKQIAARDFEGALEATAAILKADPKNVPAQVLRASALTQSGKGAEALPLLQAALAGQPDNVEALFELGRAEFFANRHAEAMVAFEKVWKLDSASLRGLAAMVEVELARRAPGAARRLIEVELDKAPARNDILMLLGSTASRTGAHDMAIATYEKVLSRIGAQSNGAAEVFLRLGDAYRIKDDMPKAVEALQKARALAPQREPVLVALAQTLDQAGRRAEARDTYEGILKLNSDNAPVANNLAFLLADTGGDLQRALTLAQQAREKLPGSLDVADTIGWIYFKAGMTAAAVQAFEALVRKNPDSGSFRFHLGMALLQQGAKARAKNEFREALQRRPSRAEVDQMLPILQKLE